MPNPINEIGEKISALEGLAKAAGEMMAAIPPVIQSITALNAALQDLQAAVSELKE
jgi:hypothetical protein